MQVLSLLCVTFFLCAGCANQPIHSQHQALRRYRELVSHYPHLVHSQGNAAQGEIQIIQDAERIESIEKMMEARYRGSMSAEVAHEASRVGVVMEDPYSIMVREAVRFPNGSEGLYRRMMSRVSLDGGPSGAYCLPLLPDGRVVLLREYRHQERAWRIGPPGGYREPGETSESAAAREALEETGLHLGPLTLLARVENDGEAIPVYVGAADTPAAPLAPDEGEALAGTVALTLTQLREAIESGGYTDASGRRYRLQGILGSAFVLLAHWQATHPPR